MLLSSFWSQSLDLQTLGYHILLATYILVFILLTLYLQNTNRHFDTLLKLACTGIAIAAAISIPYWYSIHDFPHIRLIGLGIIENPNPSSFVYGVFALLSARYATESRQRMERWGMALCSVVLLVLVLLAQSRTGTFAVLLGLWLLFLLQPRRRLALFMSAVVGGLCVVYLLVAPSIAERLTELNEPFRIQIWQQAFNQFMQAPLFGQGYQTPFEARIQPGGELFDSAHNTFLATAMDGGLIGLTLQIGLFIALGWNATRVYSKQRNPLYLVLLLYGMICMLTATDQMITRPRELWMIFWLPVALLLAHTANGNQLLPKSSRS
jgi:O-antigen ligase